MDQVDRIRHVLLEKFGLATISRNDVLQALERMHGVPSEALVGLVSQFEHSPSLIKALAGQVTLSESYFARHPDQFDAVVNALLPLIATGTDVNVWSAGCARGEEPLTVALRLFDACGPAAMAHVHIVATDIDGDSIEVAKSGLFTQWSLRTATPDMLRHFERQTSGQYQIRKELRALVEFHHSSIQDHVAHLAPRSIDVILFRNVGIYLSREALDDIHRSFHHVLRESGLLVQATTDPAPTLEWFYPQSATVPGLMRPVHAPTCQSGGETLRRFGANRKSTEKRHGKIRNATEANRGGIPNKRRLSSQTSTAPSPTSRYAVGPTPSLASAQAQLERGDAQQAIEVLRAALYLTSDDYLARYWYCIALRTVHSNARALQQARHLFVQLKNRPRDEVLVDGVTTTTELQQAVSELLEELQ